MNSENKFPLLIIQSLIWIPRLINSLEKRMIP